MQCVKPSKETNYGQYIQLRGKVYADSREDKVLIRLLLNCTGVGIDFRDSQIHILLRELEILTKRLCYTLHTEPRPSSAENGFGRTYIFLFFSPVLRFSGQKSIKIDNLGVPLSLICLP